MGFFGPSKEEQYQALRNAARNALDKLNVTPWTDFEGVTRYRWDPTVPVPLEFQYNVFLNIADLYLVVHDPTSDSLKAFSDFGSSQSAVLQELRDQLGFVQAVLAGSYTDEARSRFRALAWTRLYDELKESLKIFEDPSDFTTSKDIERPLKDAEEAFGWFMSDEGLDTGITSVAKEMGTKLKRFSPSQMEDLLRRAREALEHFRNAKPNPGPEYPAGAP